jgi:type IV fimbrial biogenesis protein FimT
MDRPFVQNVSWHAICSNFSHTKGNRMRKRENGFSLLDMMATTAVAGILTTAALPNLSSALQAHRLTASLRETVGCIRVARSSAITRNQPSRITLGANGDTLTVEVNAGGTWTAVGTPAVLETGVTVSSVSPSGGLVFTSQGTVANQVTVTVQNAVGGARQVTVSLLGAVEIS